LILSLRPGLPPLRLESMSNKLYIGSGGGNIFF
jgi:hypothetical protein